MTLHVFIAEAMIWFCNKGNGLGFYGSAVKKGFLIYHV
jgi:hypothetical protein